MKQIRPPWDWLVVGDHLDESRVELITLSLREIGFLAHPRVWRRQAPADSIERIGDERQQSGGLVAVVSAYGVENPLPTTLLLDGLTEFLLGGRLFVLIMLHEFDPSPLMGRLPAFLTAEWLQPGEIDRLRGFLNINAFVPRPPAEGARILEFDYPPPTQSLPALQQSQRSVELLRLGWLWKEGMRLDKARLCMETALKIRTALLGSDDPLVGTTYKALADLEHEAGNKETARRHLEAATAILAHRAVTSGDESVGNFRRLAEMAEANGEISDALEYRDEEMQVIGKLPHASRNVRADCHAHLGRLSQALGHQQRALNHYRQAVNLWEGSPSREDILRPTTHNNLGVIYQQLGKYPEARLALEAALQLWSNITHPRAPEVATSSYNLGVLAKLMGDTYRAKSFFETALDIRQESFQPDDPQIATVHYQLGLLAADTGLHEEAVQQLMLALMIQQGSLENSDDALNATRYALGTALMDTGDLAEARQHLEAALAGFLTRADSDIDLHLSIRAALAKASEQQGDYQAALEQRHAIIALLGIHLGEGHLALAREWESVARLTLTLGRPKDTRAALDEIAKILESRYAPGHPDLLALNARRGALSLAEGDLAGAERQLETALGALMRSLPADDVRLADSMENLAQVKHAQGVHGEARALYERALKIREKAEGRNHPSVVPALVGLGDLLLAIGHLKQAERNARLAEDLMGADPGLHPDWRERIETLLSDIAVAKSR